MKHPTTIPAFGAAIGIVTATRQSVYYSGRKRLCDNKPARKQCVRVRVGGRGVLHPACLFLAVIIHGNLKG